MPVSKDLAGHTGPSCCGVLGSNQTVVIFKEFPKVTFRYRIVGSTIKFAPVITKGCSTFRCAWAISMAYPGKTWLRVR